MPGESQRFPNIIYWSTLSGALAWIAYATVECAFSTVVPRIVWPSHAYRFLHHTFTCVLFAIYPAVGSLLGALMGLAVSTACRQTARLQRPPSQAGLAALGTATLVIAFAANLLTQSQIDSVVLVLLFLSALLLSGIALGSRSDLWNARLGFLTNPWTASTLLVGVPWVVQDLTPSRPTLTRTASALAFSALSLCISFLLHAAARHRGAGRSAPTPAGLRLGACTASVVAALAVLACSLLVNQVPGSPPINAARGASNRPNVILVVWDTVRADHLSLYGYPRHTSPNLERFAQEAALYTRAFASGDMTLSTHASIFTGLHPRRHGLHSPNPHLPRDRSDGRPQLAPDFRTLAQILSASGYLTVGIAANYAYLAPYYGFDRGFRYYDARVPERVTARRYYLGERVWGATAGRDPRPVSDRVFRCAEQINEEVFALLDSARTSGEPLFLFVNYMDAHRPYSVPRPFDTLYPTEEGMFGRDGTFDSTRYDRVKAEVMTGARLLTQAERLELIARYDAAIAHLDAQFGKLIGRLRELGLYENSLVVVTSDHGEAFGTRGLMEHGVSVYQDQVHVPLVIKYPEAHRRSVFDVPVASVDIMPTVLDVLKQEIPRDLDGLSLLDSEAHSPRIIVSESYPTVQMLRWHRRFSRVQRGALFGDLKLITSTTIEHELYDISRDPDEQQNLYDVDRAKSSDLEARLSEWVRTTPEYVPTMTNSDDSPLSGADRERLRALGYDP